MSVITSYSIHYTKLYEHLPLKLEQKQHVLEMVDVKLRLEHLLSQLETEIDILQVEKRIRGRVKRQMEKSQREYYLNEQVKAIQKELGEGEEGADLEEMDKRIKRAKMPKEARITSYNVCYTKLLRTILQSVRN